jgi:hypothetical protein
MKYEVGDLVGIGWSGILKRPFPAIVLRVVYATGNDRLIYVVRVLNEESRESWCDGTYLIPWKTDTI